MAGEKRGSGQKRIGQDANESITLLRGYEPRPLIFPERRIALFWVPKSASTFIIRWLYLQMNLLDAARFYGTSPHDFRREVFYRSESYQESIDDLLDPVTSKEYIVLKFVRNPYARAISSYIHALRYKYDNDKLARHLGRSNEKSFGFSFQEYLAYLGTIDLFHSNMHHKYQTHPLERLGHIRPTHTIKLENSRAELRAIEEEYGLEQVDYEQLRRVTFQIRKFQTDEFCGQEVFLSLKRNKDFPEYQNFYNEEVRLMVYELYEMDFRNYGFSSKLPF